MKYEFGYDWNHYITTYVWQVENAIVFLLNQKWQFQEAVDQIQVLLALVQLQLYKCTV
jgi:hypothetical protein